MRPSSYGTGFLFKSFNSGTSGRAASSKTHYTYLMTMLWLTEARMRTSLTASSRSRCDIALIATSFIAYSGPSEFRMHRYTRPKDPLPMSLRSLKSRKQDSDIAREFTIANSWGKDGRTRSEAEFDGRTSLSTTPSSLHYLCPGFLPLARKTAFMRNKKTLLTKVYELNFD